MGLTLQTSHFGYLSLTQKYTFLIGKHKQTVSFQARSMYGRFPDLFCPTTLDRIDEQGLDHRIECLHAAKIRILYGEHDMPTNFAHMIALNDVSFEFAGNYLYRNINWHIKPKERIGLVGKNGSGKTTLLRLITGTYELREGNISMAKGLKMGYLHQEMAETHTDDSIVQVAMRAFESCIRMEKEMHELYERLEHDHSQEVLDRLGHLQSEFERMGGYEMQSRTEEILEGLGFSTPDLQRPLSEFSGGWRMRVILARMLLEQPELLILDEPTNHLDLPSIEWLEQYLQTYAGTVIVVSHDRTFLNRMVTKIVELAHKKLYIWEGNYDFYQKAKQERDDLQKRQFDNQQQFIKDQEKFINRFRAKASKATAVQSRIKMLEKLDRVEEIEQDGPTMRLNFTVDHPSGKVVMELDEISKSFGTNHILQKASAHISRGDKIALIGANGKGKSTLLRIIHGSEPVLGERKEGHNVQMAFYAQHQLEALDLNATVLEELKHHGSNWMESELRNLLGCFLFGGEDVEKNIRVLSGGEKSRVALAKTLVERANFLLLDEPTNHLDIGSIEVLIEALQRFPATFVLVSHDRDFIARTANKVWWIEGQQIKEYPGTYDEFVTWQQKREMETLQRASVQSKLEKEEKKQNRASHRDDGDKQLQELKKKRNKLERRYKEEEDYVAELEGKLKHIESQLADPEISGQHQRIIELSNDHGKIETQLISAREKMENALEALMEIEEEMEQMR